MKLNPWIFPALAILVIGGWIGYQKKVAATLEREMHIVTERMRQAESQQERNTMAMAKTGRNKIGREKNGKIDIKSIAEMIAKNGYNSEANESAFAQLYDLLMDANEEELCSLLDEIGALEIDEETRQLLRYKIVRALAEKNPKLVVTRFGTEAEGSHSETSGFIGHYLGKWADTDPLGAAAWLDQQIAAGMLESKSLDGRFARRNDYETALVKALMDSDPGAAALRLKALPENQRMHVLTGDPFMFHLKQSSEASFAKLVRESVPAEKTAAIFAHIIQGLDFENNFARLDGYITNVNATAEETNAIVKMVMSHLVSETMGERFNAEKLEQTRAWAARHSPQGGDQITGAIVADYTRSGLSFDKAAELVLAYGEQSGNDEALTAFLKSPNRKEASPDALRSLIEKIKDPVIREEIVNLPQFQTLRDTP